MVERAAGYRHGRRIVLAVIIVVRNNDFAGKRAALDLCCRITRIAGVIDKRQRIAAGGRAVIAGLMMRRAVCNECTAVYGDRTGFQFRAAVDGAAVYRPVRITRCIDCIVAIIRAENSLRMLQDCR